MKRFFLILLLPCLLFACDIRNKNKKDVKANEQTTQNFKDSTSVQIIDSVYNFGKVTDGEKVEYNYRFKNTGKHPLVILTATASCGCTVPEKPEEPIKPGETGFLKVVFNSKGRVGDVHKTVTVISNAFPAFPILELRGEVTPELK
ncbi:MAG: DUF1573 domain-containing protein [Bacteroidota bacterium]|nr:DUF1573 domain-containing protein [Bacteroidota bacterium]